MMTKTSLALSSNVCGNGSICWPSSHVEHMGSEWLETPTLKPAKGRGISGAPAKRCRFMVDECSHKSIHDEGRMRIHAVELGCAVDATAFGHLNIECPLQPASARLYSDSLQSSITA